MNALAQAVMLLLLGGAVLRATFADMHLRYVKPQLEPFLIAAGVVLVATGTMTLLYELRRDLATDRATDPATDRDPDPGKDQHEHDQHGHGGREPQVGWLLLLPVLGLLLVAPPALGSYAANQAGTVSPARPADELAALPPGEPVRMSVLDYASRAVFDRGASLRGRTVELTGFLALARDGSPYLARMVLSCCAADGRPIKVGLTGNTPAGRPADTWVRISGWYTERTVPDPINGETIPYLDVETWEQIDPPRQPYE